MQVARKPNKISNSFIAKVLCLVEKGTLLATVGHSESEYYGGKKPGINADIHFNDPSCIKQIATRGDIGLGEAYMSGQIETTNLPALLTMLLENVDYFEKYFHGNWLAKFITNFAHNMNKNTKVGSKNNIKKHYDLGNEFYDLWLDDTMTYSSGIFLNECDLKAAQVNKYQQILNNLPSKPQHILEIGCGWGGFAEFAAKAGHSVTAITISNEQFQYCQDRHKSSGFDKVIDTKFLDYRNLQGQYDAIVSIEMIEAVGKEYWSEYMSTINKSLKKDGIAIIQAITISDSEFEPYLKRTDFIQKYIFPGGTLPCPTKLHQVAQKNGLILSGRLQFGESYVKTLECWLKRFDSAYDNVKALGFDDEFIRMWRFYLAYCIAGFSVGRTDVSQFTYTKATGV